MLLYQRVFSIRGPVWHPLCTHFLGQDSNLFLLKICSFPGSVHTLERINQTFWCRWTTTWDMKKTDCLGYIGGLYYPVIWWFIINRKPLSASLKNQVVFFRGSHETPKQNLRFLPFSTRDPWKSFKTRLPAKQFLVSKGSSVLGPDGPPLSK